MSDDGLCSLLDGCINSEVEDEIRDVINEIKS